MLEWFKCPDSEIIPYKDCLTKCRMKDRCETMPYLHLACSEREWTGEASTTQLLNGTMYSFLKITQPYIIDPDDVAFMIHGTKSHEQLESAAKELGLPSEFSTTYDGRNVIDLLESDNGDMTLTDYKTWGSFKVAIVLGIVKTGTKPDPSGAVYKRAGPGYKAGDIKILPVFQQMPQQADNHDAELQLNNYRVKAEAAGITISKMRVHVIVRDGSLAVARSRGVERNTYLIPIKKLDDGNVSEYFSAKATDLEQALIANRWTLPCTDRECWDGIRCRDYCEVARYCPKGLIEQGGK